VVKGCETERVLIECEANEKNRSRGGGREGDVPRGRLGGSSCGLGGSSPREGNSLDESTGGAARSGLREGAIAADSPSPAWASVGWAEPLPPLAATTMLFHGVATPLWGGEDEGAPLESLVAPGADPAGTGRPPSRGEGSVGDVPVATSVEEPQPENDSLLRLGKLTGGGAVPFP
jgi:hypothetical protein